MKLLKFIFLCVSLLIVVTSITVLLVSFNIIDSRDCYNTENTSVTNLVKNSDDNISVSTKESIPINLKIAVVSIEDERFYDHKGVDFKRSIAATFSYIINKGDSEFGGSTITQQLIKNTTKDDNRKWTRKVREWVRAIYIESKLSKDQILTEYLNCIYLGNSNYGVNKASLNYFNKDLDKLNLSECAMIAAMIQTPEATNVFNGNEEIKNLNERKNIVLDKMLELKKITEVEHDNAIKYNFKR
ncbi:MAG: biosynthetic peptidoglycan transglycosylase [Clostridia bacterium]